MPLFAFAPFRLKKFFLHAILFSRWEETLCNDGRFIGMDAVKIKEGKKHSIKVVVTSVQKDFISNSDEEMDARATQAVKSAVEKAKFCKKPIARYDKETKQAYVEYADGERKYVK